MRKKQRIHLGTIIKYIIKSEGCITKLPQCSKESKLRLQFALNSLPLLSVGDVTVMATSQREGMGSQGHWEH